MSVHCCATLHSLQNRVFCEGMCQKIDIGIVYVSIVKVITKMKGPTMRETAEQFDHGQEKYNCAQAILAAFQPHYGHDDSVIAEHKKSGGGRAEGNLCGALHAALILETDESKQKVIRNGFYSEAGSVTCRTIRAEGKLSCKECVGTAAELLETARNYAN